MLEVTCSNSETFMGLLSVIFKVITFIVLVDNFKRVKNQTHHN